MTDHALAESLHNRLEDLLREAEQHVKPLEVDPFRSRLFELFVIAYRAGYTAEGAEPDLSSDGVCRELSLRWGLTMAAREAAAQQSRLPADQLVKMRLLWSLLRMWMEWTYAWNQWETLHPAGE